MIDQPVVELHGDRAVVLDRRVHHPGAKTRFWGGLLIALAILGCILVPSVRNFDEPIDILVPLVTAVAGAVMLLVSGKPSTRDVSLAEIQLEDSVIHVTGNAAKVMPPQGRNILVDEVENIIFGMTRYPLENDKRVRIEAFTVCLSLFDGSIVPVVEATTEKVAAYRVAKFLSESLRLGIIQTGAGG